MPCGFILPDPTLPDNTIGRMGRIQGERIVIIPARKANPIKNNIIKVWVPRVSGVSRVSQASSFIFLKACGTRGTCDTRDTLF